MRITFHGAAGCVTGSRFLVQSGATRLLIDCGLFQGYKVLRERNWSLSPFDPRGLDAVLLTHAHVDHSGYLPALVRDGFRGPIHATAATCDLAAILLPDSGRIHEEDARYANARGFSKHEPAEPLYTERDARACLGSFRSVELHREITVGPFRARYQDAGHILGAASIELEADGVRVLFSGDLGRDDDLLRPPPEPPGDPDWVVMEATYGDRLHPAVDPLEALAEPIGRALARGGSVLIPAFAVGRTQAILYALHELFARGGLPRVPVHVDSPMAREVTGLYREHAGGHRLSEVEAERMVAVARYATSVADSKAIDRAEAPQIVISASGMLSGGRVLHHLKVFGPEPRNLILLPGFQAPGTRGAALAAGAREVKVHGRYLPVEAEVIQLGLFSAHADQAGLLAWLGRCARPPRGVLLVHGEPPALEALRVRVAEDLGYPVRVADHGASVELHGAEPGAR